MRRFLEARGYEVVPGQHKHLKLTRDGYPHVLLSLRPQEMVSLAAARQISAALGYRNVTELIDAIRHGDR
ncbi:MAG: hypothetical protein HY329_01920 [Chloroflexi bacterium]|nr:hypothetical protein [Chloroflexota bacterium]